MFTLNKLSSGSARVVVLVLLVAGLGIALVVGAGMYVVENGQDLLAKLKSTEGAAATGETAGEGSQAAGQRPVVASSVISADERIYGQWVNRDDVLVLVDYYADWCGPCRKIAPSLARLASSHGDKVVVLKVNVDHQKTLASRAGVRSIPDVRLLHGGRQLERVIGGRPYQHYEALVKQHASRLPAPAATAAPRKPAGSPGGSIVPFDKDWLPPGVQPAGS